MMAKEDKVIKKILEDGERKRREILAKYEKEATELRKKEEESLRKLVDEHERKLANLKSTRKSQLLSAVKLRLRKEWAKFEHEIVDNLLKEAISRFLSDNTAHGYRAWLCKMFKYLKDTEKITEGEIIVKHGDPVLDHKFLTEINRKLGTNFKLGDKHHEISGGFIVRTGDVEIDLSIDSILDVNRPNLEKEIKQSLFGC